MLSIICFYVLSSVLWCPLRFPHRNAVRFVFTSSCLFVGGFISCLRYLCLFAYSGVQHVLCCVFGLFVFVLYSILAVLLDYPFLIVLLVFSNVYLMNKVGRKLRTVTSGWTMFDSGYENCPEFGWGGVFLVLSQ